MPDGHEMARVGALVGDPGRARMLAALLDGRALTATELASQAGVARPTASGHLAKLVAAGLVVMRQQGRHRYHALASAEVASMLESMSRAAGAGPGRPDAPALRPGQLDAALRAARTCYDHMAGRLAVDLAEAMTRRGHVVIHGDGGLVTAEGEEFLRELRIDVDTSARAGRRPCRPCLDWSERRVHLAGAVGAAILRRCLDLRWVRGRDGTRALAVSPSGVEAFRRFFGVDASAAVRPRR
jgi:DNA-binding transcriptional ArsR family regulator